jgi:hypothetical protein
LKAREGPAGVSGDHFRSLGTKAAFVHFLALKCTVDVVCFGCGFFADVN